MNLVLFIEQLGDKKAADVLGAKVRTVKSWRLRVRFPRHTIAQDLIRASGGKLTMKGIYEGAEHRRFAGRTLDAS